MNARDHLLAHHIKPSVQRMVIMEYLQTHKTHPTAEEIFTALAPAVPTLSKTTVYNTLKLLVDKGAALCLTIEDHAARFDGDISDHGHFICQGCGCIRDVPLTDKQLSVLGADGGDFLVHEIHLYYKGLCKHCKEIQ